MGGSRRPDQARRVPWAGRGGVAAVRRHRVRGDGRRHDRLQRRLHGHRRRAPLGREDRARGTARGRRSAASSGWSAITSRSCTSSRPGGGRATLAGSRLSARFRLQSDHDSEGEWAWRDNPFTGTRELKGLVVVNLLLNNWDFKTSNNRIYTVQSRPPAPAAMVRGPGSRRVARQVRLADRQSQRRRGLRVAAVHQGRRRRHRPVRLSRAPPRGARGHHTGGRAVGVPAVDRITDQQWADIFRAAAYPSDVSPSGIARTWPRRSPKAWRSIPVPGSSHEPASHASCGGSCRAWCWCWAGCRPPWACPCGPGDRWRRAAGAGERARSTCRALPTTCRKSSWPPSVRLPLAAVLGTALALRPRRRGTPPRQPAVVQTQIVLGVVGALIMLVVGASLARAFGIVGAANLIRYRSKIEDPKDAVVMLCTLSVGLSAGVGLYGLAIIGTLFIGLALWIIESFEPQTRAFEIWHQARGQDAGPAAADRAGAAAVQGEVRAARAPRPRRCPTS